MYKNLIINEKIIVDGVELDGCYAVCENVDIYGVHNLKASYGLKYYPSKYVAENNPFAQIFAKQIPNTFEKDFEPTFLDGDIFEKIAEEIKIYLSLKNGWNNIIIE